MTTSSTLKKPLVPGSCGIHREGYSGVTDQAPSMMSAPCFSRRYIFVYRTHSGDEGKAAELAPWCYEPASPLPFEPLWMGNQHCRVPVLRV